MDNQITEAKVWKKFKKALEQDGFLLVDITDTFKTSIFEMFIEEYEYCPLTVEEFAKEVTVLLGEIPMRSSDNTSPMRSTS